jgi:tRNA pseudouridine55 synthase
MDGILLVDKPSGFTSHDVVAKVRSLLRQASSLETRAHSQNKLATTGSQQPAKVRVGHTGTLDPMATGLLVLVLGKYTKRAGEFSKLDKVYEAELTLGAVSTTGDSEGEITQKSAQKPTQEQVRTVLNKFLGEISQTPPQYSAVKVGGQRAYKAARAGKLVQIEPRKVKIYSITDVKYNYPKLSFTTKVSSGTYIRSLAEDIGQALGTGAYLSKLVRREVGIYKMVDTVSLNQLSAANIMDFIHER